MECRFCNSSALTKFLDLGFAPPSNANLTQDGLNKLEKYYPLRTVVCDNCFLVQTEDFLQSDELFEDSYTYFSSASKGWLLHAKNYVDRIIKKLSLDKNSLVVELASNDGYLLQNFVRLGIPCFGVEPTSSTTMVSQKKGIKVYQEFFSENLSTQLIKNHGFADLIIGNNVYAHVPDINDFTKGISNFLHFEGTVTLEFPHLLKLITLRQFDTIYHEHFSYFSLTTVNKIFTQHGLKVYDVDEIPTHGGSLRIYGCKKDHKISINKKVEKILAEEKQLGLTKIKFFKKFSKDVNMVKLEILNYLITKKSEGKRIYAYGAAAKGNTLLNYCGIDNDLIDLIFDAAESKQGKFTPGSHIPILSPDDILKNPIPDIMVIFPWNIKEEIVDVLSEIKTLKGVEIVTFIPNLKISNL